MLSTPSDTILFRLVVFLLEITRIDELSVNIDSDVWGTSYQLNQKRCSNRRFKTHIGIVYHGHIRSMSVINPHLLIF